MHDFIKKLLDSKSTLIILLWVAVFAYAYNLDYIKKPIIKHQPKGRTIEEIIATTVEKAQDPEWDKDFKSTVEPIK